MQLTNNCTAYLFESSEDTLMDGHYGILGNKLNESKFYSGSNKEQIEVMECLLSFGAECFVFPFAIQKYKDFDIQDYNFACCFAWV